MVVSPKSQRTAGIDRTKLRLSVLAVLVVAAFVALFSRLWFLQVLASEDYLQLAKDNRVRKVQTEPPRGEILDRNGVVLAGNRPSLSVTLDRVVLDTPEKVERVLRRLSRVLEVPVKELKRSFKGEEGEESPYKPVAVAHDIPESVALYLGDNKENFRGVEVEDLPVRDYPNGKLGAHILGYVGEIPREYFKLPLFKEARPRYQAGDLVGRSGIELAYDRFLRGTPGVQRITVNSADDVIAREEIQDEEPGRNLHLSLDIEIQRVAEKALRDGILAARGRYQAPAGAVVVEDPLTGEVIAMASFPTYDPDVLADGISGKEFNELGEKTPDNPDDDALLNRAIQAERHPGSTFKVVTAGAAMATGIATPATTLPCPGASVYPPDGRPGAVTFHNWTSASFGTMGFPRSLEVSCDTFYYELGWRMETAFGPFGDESERFQKYARAAGFDEPTGIDLPNEQDGVIPDVEWCEANEDIGFCPLGWLPGFTVNMSIGQGDVAVTPLQMANAYASIANGGTVWEPRLGMSLGVPDEEGDDETVREFDAKRARSLPLDAVEMGVIRDGLLDVIAGVSGTARGAFAGFPLDRFPISGKTGTAELGESGLNDAWFISYGPGEDPDYVISVYVEKAGHGGETAAPIARQIWEGILGIDKSTDVNLAQDASG